MLMLMLMLILMLVSLLLVWLIDTPIALSQSVCLVHLIVATVWHRRHSLCSLLWPSDCVRQRLIVAHSGKWSSDHWSEQWSQTVTDRHSFDGCRSPMAASGDDHRLDWLNWQFVPLCATIFWLRRTGKSQCQMHECLQRHTIRSHGWQIISVGITTFGNSSKPFEAILMPSVSVLMHWNQWDQRGNGWTGLGCYFHDCSTKWWVWCNSYDMPSSSIIELWFALVGFGSGFSDSW